jgi:hypothetical protein
VWYGVVMTRVAASVCLAVLSATCAACGSSSSDTRGLGGSSGSDGSAEAGDGFDPFFNGADLDGLEVVGISPSELSIEDGVLKCTGQSNGYLYRGDVYGNFVLALQFRFERPADLAPGADGSFMGNSGYFVYLQPPHAIWPTGLEVQGHYQETGDVFQVPSGLDVDDNPDPSASEAARRPVGEWNDLTITSLEGSLAIELNGLLVNQSAPADLREGLVALQSEGAEIHWRDVRIKRLP